MHVNVFAGMGKTIFFYSIQLSLSFDSTQLMAHNDFTRFDSNQLTTQNGYPKFDTNRLTTQKPPEF